MLGRIEVDARLAMAAPLVVEGRVGTAGRRLAGWFGAERDVATAETNLSTAMSSTG
jgi:hypothetical protein